MTARSNTFECGTNGVTITTANSGGSCGDAFDNVQIGLLATCAFDNTQSFAGLFSMRQATGLGLATVFTTWNFAATPRLYGSVAVRLGGLPALVRPLFRVNSGGTQTFRVATNALGNITLNNQANAVVATSVLTLTADTWFRLDFDVTVGVSAPGAVSIFNQAGTLLETLSVTADFGVGNQDSIDIGTVSGILSLPNAFYDSVNVSDVGPIVPFSGSPGDLQVGGNASRFAVPYTTAVNEELLDIDRCLGQRSSTFRFDLVDSVSGERLGEIHPVQDSIPTLTHDTTRTIKRQVAIQFGVADTAAIDTLRDRILISMVLSNGVVFPLGRYMFVDQTRLRFSSGLLSTTQLTDEMFIVDQELENTFSATTANNSVESLIKDLLRNLPITTHSEPTGFTTVGSWTAGTRRAKVLEDLSIDGDFFSPWFDNNGTLRFIRVFDPATVVPTFDLDSTARIIFGSIAETDDLLIAPNRIIVISNAGGSNTPIVGRFDIPNSAPHSIANRGFVIPKVIDRQIQSPSQAISIAQNIGQRQTLFERVQLSTVPDPRHDSYDVIIYNSEKWLEIAWSIQLIEGGEMIHSMRKVYS